MVNRTRVLPLRIAPEFLLDRARVDNITTSLNSRVAILQETPDFCIRVFSWFCAAVSKWRMARVLNRMPGEAGNGNKKAAQLRAASVCLMLIANYQTAIRRRR